jgi:hypothetical protein
MDKTAAATAPTSEIVPNHRASRRMTRRSVSTLFTNELSMIKEVAARIESGGGDSNSEVLAAALAQLDTNNSSTSAAATKVLTKEEQDAIRITEYRKQHAIITSEEVTNDNEIDADMKETVSYISRIGRQLKRGYLAKQSKLLGRWKKRVFILYDDFLCYFDSEKDLENALKSNKGSYRYLTRFLKPEKVFALTGACITYYTNTQYCFSLSLYSNASGALQDDVEPWYLLATSDK